MQRTRYASSMAARANPELWIKLTLPGVGQVGPGKVELLRKIDEQQSIAAAARAMAMSYRRAWLLVDEMNKLFAQPVVSKWQGGSTQGGASLTKFGEKLVASYDVLVERSNRVNRALLSEIGRTTKRAHKIKKS
jgi:molybdate transport system regulatory protein